MPKSYVFKAVAFKIHLMFGLKNAYLKKKKKKLDSTGTSNEPNADIFKMIDKQ